MGQELAILKNDKNMKQSEGAIGLAIEAYKEGIKEAQLTIDTLQAEMKKLQDICPHNHMMPQTRAWAPGHHIEGQVCEICDYWEVDKMDFETVITATNIPWDETFTVDMSKKDDTPTLEVNE